MLLECEFCARICKNKNSLSNHQRLCKLNPNRTKTWFEQQIELGKTFKHSEETKKKIKRRKENVYLLIG